MKYLFLDAYFYPENIAFTHLEQDIIEGLKAEGHRITVVCPTPCRGIPEETIRKYHNIKHENYRGIHIHRYQAPREGKNPLIRAFRYFWCNLRGSRIAKHYRDIDAVFAVSTPPTQGYFAGKMAKKLGVPLIYSLQDLFPDSLATTGLAKRNSLLYRIGARLERKTYALCAKIIVLSRTAEKQLLERGVPESRLITVGNWVDTEAVRPVPRGQNRLFDEFGVDRTRFNVVYAGNFGASQGTDVILKAAALMQDNEEISFVLFGSGSEFEKAKKSAEELQLRNTAIHPLLPPDRVSEVYSMGDAALITCKKGVGKTALPSKLWSIMACETPVIAAFDADSELSDILRESDAGVCVEPENARLLRDAITDAYEKKKAGIARTGAAREYVIRHASKTACVKRYVDCFEQAAGSAQTRRDPMNKMTDSAKPKISVVIPFYRGAGWLAEAVDSVLKQDYENLEIIVINDGSKEDTAPFLEKYQAEIRYIKTENRGAAAARNRGISEARGDYIAFLDSDDLWLPEKLSFQTAKMQEYGALWSYTDYETFGENTPTMTTAMTPERKEGMQRRFSPYIGTPTVTVARSLLSDSGFRFSEDLRYGQDAVLWEQLIHAAPVLYLPRVLSRVRIRGTNAGKRAAVQLCTRVAMYDKCVELIPGYKNERSVLFRTAIALCRFGRLFVKKDKMDTKAAEAVARVMFAAPYLLFKLDRRLSADRA